MQDRDRWGSDPAPTFTDPPATVDLPPPPDPPRLWQRIVIIEAVSLLTWGILAAGGAANPDPAGLPALAVVVGVFAWLTGREW